MGTRTFPTSYLPAWRTKALDVTLRYVTLRYVSFRYVSLRFVTFRYVPFRFIGRCRSPQRRRHGPGSGSDRAGWWCGGGRLSESRAGGGCHRPAGRGWHVRAGHGPVPAASGLARPSRLVRACPFVRSFVPYGTRPAVDSSWGTNRARHPLRRSRRGAYRGTDSYGAPTNPGATGY